jgi:preprotein translocase subunit SecG
MGVLTGFVLVLFVILCVLLVIIILMQSDKSSGMGLLGGSSQSTFGSSTADVITKITAVMVGIFLVGSLGISALESVKLKSMEKSLRSSDTKSVGKVEENNAAASTPAAPAKSGDGK